MAGHEVRWAYAGLTMALDGHGPGCEWAGLSYAVMRVAGMGNGCSGHGLIIGIRGMG
jgi:hypothetical protein